MQMTTRNFFKLTIEQLNVIRRNSQNSHEVKILASSMIHYKMARRDVEHFHKKRDKVNFLLAKKCTKLAAQGIKTSMSYMGANRPFQVYA